MTKPRVQPTRRPEIPERHALCTRRCRSCIHGFDFGEGAGCEYILNTTHRRPCPAGTGCTEFERGPSLQAALQRAAPVAATAAAAAAMEERIRRGKIAPRKDNTKEEKE